MFVIWTIQVYSCSHAILLNMPTHYLENDSPSGNNGWCSLVTLGSMLPRLFHCLLSFHVSQLLIIWTQVASRNNLNQIAYYHTSLLLNDTSRCLKLIYMKVGRAWEMITPHKFGSTSNLLTGNLMLLDLELAKPVKRTHEQTVLKNTDV